MREAVNAGINFFDNAWSYSDSLSEECIGLPTYGYRQRVFLMTKKLAAILLLRLHALKKAHVGCASM